MRFRGKKQANYINSFHCKKQLCHFWRWALFDAVSKVLRSSNSSSFTLWKLSSNLAIKCYVPDWTNMLFVPYFLLTLAAHELICCLFRCVGKFCLTVLSVASVLWPSPWLQTWLFTRWSKVPFPAKCPQLRGMSVSHWPYTRQMTVLTALAASQLSSDKELIFLLLLNASSVIKIQENYTVHTSNETVNACCIKDFS